MEYAMPILSMARTLLKIMEEAIFSRLFKPGL